MTLVILGEQEASWLLPYAHPWHATVSCIADIGYPCMDSATTANTIRAAAIAHNIIRQWSGLVKDLDASIIIMDVPQIPGIGTTDPTWLTSIQMGILRIYTRNRDRNKTLANSTDKKRNRSTTGYSQDRTWTGYGQDRTRISFEQDNGSWMLRKMPQMQGSLSMEQSGHRY